MDAVQALNVKRLYESNRRRSENVQKLMQEEAKKHALVVEKHENKMRTWRETLAHTSAEVQALRSKFQDLTGKLLPPLEAGTSSDGDAAPPRSLSGSTNGHANGAMLSPTIAAGAAQDAAQHGSGSAPADVAQMRSSGSLDMQDVLADYTMDLSKPEVAAAAELAENNTDAMEPPPIPATPEVHATAALHSPYAAGEHTTSPLKATADTGAPPHAAAGGEGGSDEELPEAEPADWPAPRLPPGFGGPAKVFPAPPPAAPYIGRDRHMSDSDQDSMDMHADPEDPYHTSPVAAGFVPRGSAAAGPVGAPSADRDLAAPARVGNRRLVQLEASHAAQRARPDDLDSFHDEFPGLTLGGQAAAPSSGFAAAASANAVANARLHAHVDQEEEEFPGLNLGVVRRQEWSQDEGSKDAEFPSLGGAAPAARPAGVWGSASAARLLQQDAGKAMALLPASGQKLWPGLGQAAAPTPTSRPGVEKWEVEYELRVRSDLTPDIERRRQMLSKTDFEYYEEIRRRRVNVVDGLELHRNVLSLPEQEQLIECITGWVHDGREGRLRGRTFSAPRKWSPGKGRMTIQFGCCYNYAVDREGRKPGIIPEEVVEELPPVLVALCKRLVRWGVLPKALEPDSAIINVYEPGDCIPPHIDHHDFVRPFCTLSLLSQQSIMFGQRLVPLAPGQFGGSDFYVPLPTGSCLVLKGNGADVAMHCVPPVSERRMSITLRKMGPAHSDLVKQFLERQRARKNGW
ncbi:hypothetical protein WJX72_002516 [[Myrmecia] bisecta]|uniref:Fe2OG dioxygenase domain-containing protein n=1 Tax=[Myrmecia] bisecta TaxID=41462 RepID=A0AAW1R5S3_9CHLO